MRNPILTVCRSPTQHPSSRRHALNSLKIAWGEPHLATAKQGNPQMRKWRINFAPLSHSLAVSLFCFLFDLSIWRLDNSLFKHISFLFSSVTVLSALLFFLYFLLLPISPIRYCFIESQPNYLSLRLWYHVSLKSNFSLPTVLGIINRTLLTCHVCRLIFKHAHPLIESDTLEGFKGVGRFFNPFFDVF